MGWGVVGVEGALEVDDAEVVGGANLVGAQELVCGAGGARQCLAGVVVNDNHPALLHTGQHELERVADALIKIAVEKSECNLCRHILLGHVFEPAFVDYRRFEMGFLELADELLFANGQLASNELVTRSALISPCFFWEAGK